MTLNTREEIDTALDGSTPTVVVGLNGRGQVQLQLPAGCNYMQMNAEQARDLAAMLLKHADLYERRTF